MDSKGWRNRDWIWVVGVLITIIILLIAGFYNSKAIELNFSIISSAVSIALALVAIFIALKQDSDNQTLNARLVDLLNGIQVDVKSVDAKLDPKVLNSVGEETADVYSRKIENQPTYTKEEVDQIINNVSKDIISNISDILNEENYKTKNWNKKMREESIKNAKIANIIINNKNKNLEELQEIIAKETGTMYTVATISKYRRNVFDSYAG